MDFIWRAGFKHLESDPKVKNVANFFFLVATNSQGGQYHQSVLSQLDTRETGNRKHCD